MQNLTKKCKFHGVLAPENIKIIPRKRNLCIECRLCCIKHEKKRGEKRKLARLKNNPIILKEIAKINTKLKNGDI